MFCSLESKDKVKATKNSKNRFKGVIYSLDAFISAGIAFIAVYLLLNYSTLEQSYVDYYQLKLLSLDGLRTLIEDGAINDRVRVATILNTIIPERFMYRLERDGNTFVERTFPGKSIDDFSRIRVSSSILVPILDRGSLTNPYSYKTCGGPTLCKELEEGLLTLEEVSIVEYTLIIAV